VPAPSRLVPPRLPRELLVNLTLRELRGKFKRSTLGYLWSVINPAVNLAIYTVVFGVFLEVTPPTGDPSGLKNYGFFLVAALIPWSFVTNSLGGAVGVMVGNEGLIKKVYFPRSVLPASVILSFLVGFLVELGVLIVAFALVGNIVLPFLPVMVVLVLLQTGFVMGLGLALSVANAYFRDIQHFLAIFLNVWFYATPILYPRDLVPEEATLLGIEVPLGAIVDLNPMTAFTNAFRDAMYHLRAPSLSQFGFLALTTAGSLLFGILVFRRLEPRLAEEL
jgi:ABC-type polysaccharide/polyol phosphate export permease